MNPPVHSLALLMILAGCASCRSCGATSGSTATYVAPERYVPTERELSPFVAALMDAHGMTNLDYLRVTFSFRGQAFDVRREFGVFSYERTAEDRETVDTLTNDGFSRQWGGADIPLEPHVRSNLAESVNSVVYFAFLPYPLGDPAVQLQREGQVTIDGRRLKRARVTFDEEGGGSDHDDEFYYWFDASSLELVYMAYRYARGEGGVRFRVAKNARRVGGVLFFDYDNFAYDDLAIDLADLPSRRAPESGPALELLSEIVLDDVEVLPLRPDEEVLL
ncbi:MAG: DUF6503 family protein [Myxococcota bacterium]